MSSPPPKGLCDKYVPDFVGSSLGIFSFIFSFSFFLFFITIAYASPSFRVENSKQGPGDKPTDPILTYDGNVILRFGILFIMPVLIVLLYIILRYMYCKFVCVFICNLTQNAPKIFLTALLLISIIMIVSGSTDPAYKVINFGSTYPATNAATKYTGEYKSEGVALITIGSLMLTFVVAISIQKMTS
jgi:TRAP-type mannitol/chloroaromatic compound transport system permease small subunit